MPSIMRTAFAANDNQEVIRRRSDEDKRTTLLAKRPSKRLRDLESRRSLNVPLKEEELYRGEDLRIPR